MAWGGSAPAAVGVMWFLTALVFFFLCLRLYTRLVCLASYGIDDHIYAVAFVFLLIFNVFTHLAANYGFGQTMEEIGNPDFVVQATLYECIGQAFAIVGMSIAKASLGAFLLRLVVIPWHRWAIWVMMTFVVLASIAQVLVFWLACVPLEFVYDRFIEGGSCPIDTRPTSYILCTSTIMCDFFFAILPWFIVHSLQMPRREKYTIALSFSLGLIAAAAGIVRMTTVSGLYTMDYLKDSVPLIVWSAAEMAVTLICIGIPVCRPVYRRIYHHFYPDKQTSGYRKQNYDPDNPSFALKTIGGGGRVNKSKVTTREKEVSRDASANRDVESGNSEDGESFSGVKVGRVGHFSQARGGRGVRAAGPDNASDEEILGGDYWRNQVQPQTHQQQRNPGIIVTETVRVDRS